MTDYLKYKGILKLSPILNDKEVNFFNNWQKLLLNIYENSLNKHKTELPSINSKINTFLNFDFNELQRWTIMYNFNPLITFTNNEIIIDGTHSKGQLRDSLLSLIHFFIGENPVIKNCTSLDFIQEHNLKGIIEAEKNGQKWCYIIDDNNIYSVTAPDIENYLKDPFKYVKIEKEDHCMNKLNRYFPKVIQYGNIAKNVPKKSTVKINKIKL